jgi:hypothetical protein
MIRCVDAYVPICRRLCYVPSTPMFRSVDAYVSIRRRLCSDASTPMFPCVDAYVSIRRRLCSNGAQVNGGSSRHSLKVRKCSSTPMFHSICVPRAATGSRAAPSRPRDRARLVRGRRRACFRGSRNMTVLALCGLVPWHLLPGECNGLTPARAILVCAGDLGAAPLLAVSAAGRAPLAGWRGLPNAGEIGGVSEAVSSISLAGELSIAARPPPEWRWPL